MTLYVCSKGGGFVRNESFTDEELDKCSIPILNAKSLSLAEIARRCAAAETPLIIKGLLHKPQWNKVAAVLGDRKMLVDYDQSYAAEKMTLNLGSFLAQGPEKDDDALNNEKLAYMREHWTPSSPSSSFLKEVFAEVRAGNARPQIKLADFISVTLASLSDAARGGHRWIQMHLASTATTSGATPLPGLPDTGLLLPLVRLGVGGTGSGAPFHDHMPAINVAFAGRKRWLVAKPGTELVLVGPNDLLKMLPQQEFQAALAGLERGGKMWQCTQQPGEAVYVPAMFLHAIVNMDEVVSVAIQADDHDPAAAFAALLANAGVDGALRLVQESQRQGYGDLARYISDLLPK
eukprot:gene7753-8719_t